MTRKKLKTIAQKLRQLYPNGSEGLNHHDDLTLYVSIVLAAQSRDKVVNRVLANFPYNTFQELATADISEIYQHIKSVGYASNKARLLKKGAQIILENDKPLKDYSFEELLKLPGIGTKSAAYIRWVLHDDAKPVVDTHMQRVINRIFDTRMNHYQIYEWLMENADEDDIRILNDCVVQFGRDICSQTPRCKQCPITSLCKFYQANGGS